MRVATLNRNVLVLGVAMLCAACVLGCSRNDQDDIQAATLNRGLNGDPESLDPHLYSSRQAGDVIRDLGEGLLGYASSGELTGGVASSWEVAEDGLQYTFRIRDDARWSNGEPITAADLVDSMRRLVDPATASPNAQSIMAVKNAGSIVSGNLSVDQLGVTAANEKILVISLESPTPYFLQLLTNPSTFPVYIPNIKKYGGSYTRAQNLVTNGAYKLDYRSPGSVIRLRRNIHYWNDSNTSFDRVNYVIADPAVEVALYRAGELDLTNNVDSSIFEKMREERASELRVSPSLGVYYYGLNVTRPPFENNPSLRKALSLAIDRQTIVSAITRRGEQPAYSLVPPGVHNYESQRLTYSEMTQAQREEEAKKLYRSAGYGDENRLTVELRYNTIGGHEVIAQAVQSMWRDVLGVNTVLINEEFRVFISNVMAMEITEAYRLSWVGDYDDALTFLQLLKAENPNNLTGFSNNTVDSSILAAAGEVDPAKRRSNLEAAERVGLEAHPIIPIYFYVNKHLVRNDIVGWRSNPLDIHYSKDLSRLDTDARR